HRRRPLLDRVRGRAFGADRLAVLAQAQEVDEARAGDDRDHHRDDPGDQDVDHYAGAPVRASATRSSPIARAPLTRTQARGGRRVSRSGTASRTVSTWLPP